MHEEWWERPVCHLCNYWWLLVIILALGLGIYFTKVYWGPLIWQPTPTVMPSQTPTLTLVPTQTSTNTPEPTLPPSATPTRVATLGTGDIQVMLTWNTTDDLDLWVNDPAGSWIGFSSRNSPSGGQLDVDANAGCDPSILTSQPVENIFWPVDGALVGDYLVEVRLYRRCIGNEAIPYHVKVIVNGVTQDFDGTVVETNETDFITNFTFTR